MKRLSFIVLALCSILFAEAQEYTYDDSWGEPGMTVKTQSAQEVLINFSIDKHFFQELRINGEIMTEILLPEIFLPAEEGSPNLPGTGRYIALPVGASVSYELIDYRVETFQNIQIAPSPRIPWDTETGPLEYEKDASIYSANKFYPEEPVILGEKTAIRGVDGVMLGITPFQYNPVTKELLVYRDMVVRMKFDGGNNQFGEDRLRSRWWDPILRNIFLNQASIPSRDYNRSFQESKDVGCEYLIVTPNNEEFQTWADSIRVFRTRQGIQTDIITIDDIGANNISTLEDFFDDAYAEWDVVPSAVLLLGDYDVNGDEGIVSPIWDYYCASDNIYADVSNNDMPDIIFARMTAQNEVQLETMVTKFLDYERTPPTSEDFYQHPITALGWQTERWFQICSESIGGFWKNELGKDPVRINEIYDGSPAVDPWSTATNTNVVLYYFGPNGLDYIPAYPSELDNWSDGNANDVNDALNNGSFMLQHRDHGYEMGWGEPGYSNGDINDLTNTDLSFILSINCLTGKYNISNECFTEKFHRYKYNGENAGALGLIAASEVSYSFVNDAFVWGIYDHMWPEFLPTFGSEDDYVGIFPAFANAAGKYFLKQSSWPYNTDNKEVTYNLFHHHGDAFLNVYSEVPQDLMVVHNDVLLSGTESFTLATYEGAFIALTVNDEIIATATAIDGQTEIEIPPQTEGDQMIITITKQNYYRYESTVEVIDNDIAYVIIESSEINDINGNGNGVLDYGELINLSVAMENIGTVQADAVEVILSSQNDNISFTDNSELFGDFLPGEVITMDNAFTFEVNNLIPDNEYVIFQLEATDGESLWTSQVVYKSHAPVLEYISYSINDETGNNNGRLDPGETVEVIVELANFGSAEAKNVMGELICEHPEITVTGSTQNYGDIASGVNALQVFEVSIDGSFEEGDQAEFEIAIDADGGITASGLFESVVGQYVALILDLDLMNHSGPGIHEAFGDMEVFVDYSTTFPEDLSLYKNIFVCLGLHFTNYEMSNTEGQLLKDYLLDGGNIYMEGRLTWKDDPQTPVHSMFNVEADAVGMFLIDDILGLEGSMTWNMLFDYDGNNPVCDYSLVPISPAYSLFSTQDAENIGMVAYNEGSYKTIASTIEFGKLMDGDSPSTKTELLAMLLDWFEGTITNTEEFGLYQTGNHTLSAQPNPFNYETSLTVAVQKETDISIVIRNSQGKLISTIFAGQLSPGNHEFKWDGTSQLNESVPPGVYVIVLRSGETTITRKLIRIDN